MGLMPRVFLAAGALMLVQAAVTSGAWAQAQGMPTPSEPPGAGTSGQGYVPPGQSDFEKAVAPWQSSCNRWCSSLLCQGFNRPPFAARDSVSCS